VDSIKVYPETDFKETSIGKVPRDWDVTRIEEVCEVVGGGTPSTYVKEYWNGEIPFVTPTDITELEKRNVNFLDKTKSYITKKGLKNSSAKLLPPNSVLLTSRATIGYGLINKIPMATNQGFANLICSEKAYNLYILYLMRFLRKTLLQMASGSTFKEVARGVLRNLKIPLPSVQEQRMISDILCIVDDVLFKTDGIITKTELLKRGLMQELLTKGIGHTEFKYSKELSCEIPKDWSVVKLRDLGENKESIVAGPFGSNLKVKDYVTEGVPIIRLQNIERNKFINENIKYTSPEKARELSYHSFQPGDIVLAKLGDPIGKTCIVPSFVGKGIVVADVVRIRLSPKKAINKFIEYMLNSSICYEQLRKETIGSTRPRTNITQIRNLELPLSSLEEQQKIADILSTVDNKLQLERREKAELESVKQALMDLFLTGKVRVKVN
jgi:type I restriction enzyme S subunit